MPSALLEALNDYKNRQQGPNPYNLVFPAEAGRPDKNFESKLKNIAKRAGLNCGTCASRHGNRCSEGPYCSNWFLHKFRHTFATVNLEGNVCSIRKLQEWLGHKDLASTMVYLKYVRGKDVHSDDRILNDYCDYLSGGDCTQTGLCLFQKTKPLTESAESRSLQKRETSERS